MIKSWVIEMGGRYVITGVQIGIIRAFANASFRQEEASDIHELLDVIQNEQFVGMSSPNSEIKMVERPRG